ncbi:hypothetical protein [Kitasatospora albolonga]|uniref:hypothetical protein n=1 Tax=Kitasatospora albolonga TaxID=68173 RepID=UPI0031F0B77A
MRASVLGQLGPSPRPPPAEPRRRPPAHPRGLRPAPPHRGPGPPVGDYHATGGLGPPPRPGAGRSGDLGGAIKSLETSRRAPPPHREPARTPWSSPSWRRQLTAGRLDAACSTWHQFLDVYPHLSSRRAPLRRRPPATAACSPTARRHPADHLLQRATALRLPS